MPTDYDKEKWVEIYKKAILELEHAKMTGRIGDARIELAARIEKLRDVRPTGCSVTVRWVSVRDEPESRTTPASRIGGAGVPF